MSWNAERVDEVWKALEHPRERPVRLLRARFRKDIDLADVSATVADQIAELFVFWGALQVEEAWTMPELDRRTWLGEARTIFDDASRAATAPAVRDLAIFNRGLTELLLALEPDGALAAAGRLGLTSGPLPHTLDRNTFPELAIAACETLAPFDNGANGTRTIAAALLGLCSMTSTANQRIAWLQIAERDPDAGVAELCGTERARLEALSWFARRGQPDTPHHDALLPISIAINAVMLPSRARAVLDAWTPIERDSDGPYR